MANDIVAVMPLTSVRGSHVISQPDKSTKQFGNVVDSKDHFTCRHMCHGCTYTATRL